MTPDPPDSPELERLVESFMERRRRGERPSIEDYCREHPNLADEIRAVFPALEVIEEFGSVAEADVVEAVPLPIPRRLGEFELLREVGRGGMGVVYEAVQPSLGRHVALKVLPPHAHVTAVQRERFRREAQAAARLHHTNIVPVFGVGEVDGVHYFAMQFIRGQSLDAVLQELRRLRGGETAGDSPASEAAHGLLTGGSGLSAGGSSAERGRYYRNVAEVGAQVADALAYAHRNGIVHRDVKPSNLLLDTRGTVWVTDFGLAKADGVPELTNTGDVLGTLRYIAPEQLAGQSEPRSDVYSLGLTLYELATLAPAFDDPVRVRLIQRVRSEDPPAPRRLDPDIPRDLETIILRATAKEPHSRYPTAEALATDLRRFLADRSILARRESWAGQGWRWCRRNPAVAALSGVVFLLLLAIAAVSTISAVRLGRERVTTLRLNDELKTRLADLSASRLAEREAKQRLGDSLWRIAVATRDSDRPGRRFDALAALATAAGSRPNLELRNEAVACLALADVTDERHHESPRSTLLPDAIDFDPALAHYVRLEGQDVVVRSLAGGRDVVRIPREGRIPLVARFSPDGRLLAMRFEQRPPTLEVWEWRIMRSLYRTTDAVSERAFDLSPDGRTLSIGFADGSLKLIDLETKAERAVGGGDPGPFVLRYDPAGKRFAVSYGTRPLVKVFAADTGKLLHTLKQSNDAFGLAWDQEGETLAVGDGFDVALWSPDDPSAPPAVLRAQTTNVHDIAFHPGGRLVVSNGMDGLTRLWDRHDGQLLLRVDHLSNRFSRDGTRLSYRGGGRIGVWKVATGAECLRLVGHERRFAYVSGTAFHPEGEWLATAGSDGLRLWDVGRRRGCGHLAIGPVHSVGFDPAARQMVTASDHGLHRWPLHEGEPWRIGPPVRVATPRGETPARLAFPDGGGRMAVSFFGSARALLFEPTGAPRPLVFHSNLRQLAFSPDGAWAAGGRHDEVGFGVWETRTGKLVHTFHRSSSGPVAFSRDGTRLFACENAELVCWEVGTWKQLYGLPRPDSVGTWALAVSPRGDLVAYTRDRARVQLIDPASGAVRAELTPAPRPDAVSHLAFSPGGGLLAAACGREGVRLWDLRMIRAGLGPIGLDWDGEALPSESKPGTPLRVEVDLGELKSGK